MNINFQLNILKCGSRVTSNLRPPTTRKGKSMVKQCLGASTVEKVYELKFTEKNAKMLLDKRMSDKIQFIVRERPQVEPSKWPPM